MRTLLVAAFVLLSTLGGNANAATHTTQFSFNLSTERIQSVSGGGVATTGANNSTQILLTAQDLPTSTGTQIGSIQSIGIRFSTFFETGLDVFAGKGLGGTAEANGTVTFSPTILVTAVEPGSQHQFNALATSFAQSISCFEGGFFSPNCKSNSNFDVSPTASGFLPNELVDIINSDGTATLDIGFTLLANLTHCVGSSCVLRAAGLSPNPPNWNGNVLIDYNYSVQTTAPVPVPATLPLLLTAMAGLGLLRCCNAKLT